MLRLIIFIFTFQLCFSETLKKWNLDIKNKDNGNEIILIPGQFTKIFFVLSNLEDNNNFIQNDESSYKLSIEDTNIISLNNNIILTPKENLVYSTYIGIKCINLISNWKNTYTINLKIESNNDLTDDKSIEYYNPTVTVNRKEKINISLNCLIYYVVDKGSNYFYLNKEIYNVDEISLKNKDIEGLEFKDIIIKPFGQREILSRDNPANHRILFDYPFGVTKEYNDFNKDETFIEIELSFKNIYLENCFELDNLIYFEVTDIKDEINEQEKNNIINNFEDYTLKFDSTNNIQLKVDISLSPIIVTCQLEPKSLLSENSIEKFNNKSNKIYKNIFINDNDKIITINNLEFDVEYYANCEFSTTEYNEKEKTKMNITIGNFKNADIVHQLKSSKDKNRIPQCVKFTFERNIILDFKKNGELLCKYYMKKDEPLKIRDSSTVICEIIEVNEENATICVSPEPESNLDVLLSDEDNKYKFNKKFDEFIEKIKTYYNVKNVEEKELDLNIYPYLISASIIKIEDSSQEIKFNIDFSSNNNQQIICYYNSKLSDENKQFVNMDSSIVLSPKETKQLEVGLNTETSQFNVIYSLNLKCYNLPYFNYKYEETGPMILYSYLYITNKYIDQTTIITPKNILINCDEKVSQQNPVCLKNNIMPVTELFKTQIPEFVKEIDIKLHQFSKLSEDVKKYYMVNLLTNLKYELDNKSKDNLKYYYQKSIKYLKYLSYIDCSKYSSGETNDEDKTIKNKKYIECRNKKKESIQIIFNLTYYTSNSAYNDILNRLGNNLEENLKYVLIFINELSKNPEAYEKDNSNIIIDNSIILQKRFTEYWARIEDYLKNKKKSSKSYIIMLKKEVIYSILEILISVSKIIHFNEIDGYIDKEHNSITKSGLILYDKAVDIHNGILNISPLLNEFNKTIYQFSGISFSAIEMSEDNNPSFYTKKKTIKINEDIKIEINLNYLLGNYQAKTLQILVFDSPLISVIPCKDSNQYSNTINHFISIRLFKDDGEIIPIKDLDKNYRTNILYNKKRFKKLKGCYYYNETLKLLAYDGLTEDSYTPNFLDIYFKCTTNHLALLTVGTNKIEDEFIIGNIMLKKEIQNILEIPSWKIVFVLLGIVFGLTFLIYFLMKCNKKNEIVSNKNNNENANNPEDILKLD